MVSYSDTPMHLCSASGGFWCPPKSLLKSGEKFGKMAQLSGFLAFYSVQKCAFVVE